MKRITKWVILLLSICAPVSVLAINPAAVKGPIKMPAAAPVRANLSCSRIMPKLDDKNFVLTLGDGDKPRIIIFQNTSQQSLWLDHPVAKRSASAGWASYLRPNKWAALWLNRSNFIISCSVINPGQVDFKHCAQSVTVCVPTKANYDSKRKGTYWLVEDMEWDELVKTLDKKGINQNSAKDTKQH